MASTAAFNDKSAPVYSPASSSSAATQPSGASAAPIPYAVKVDADEPPAAVLIVHPPQFPVAATPISETLRSSAWEVELFDFFSMPAHCLVALFFPCANGAYAAHWIGLSGALVGVYFFAMYTGNYVFAALSYADDPNAGVYYPYTHSGSISTGNAFNKWHTASTICSVLFAIGVFALRRRVREFYHIHGSPLNDCCCSFWCSCCVLAQLSAHTEIAKSRRSASTATLPAYPATQAGLA